MRKSTNTDSNDTRNNSRLPFEAPAADDGVPRRLLSAFEVAELVGCHEESVRRAYLCGQLRRQRFGVRSWRFHPSDVEEWIRRGATTRVS
jgi:excisionase family DNA binding protein